MARTQIDKSLIPSIGTLSLYRRPNLIWASITQVNVDDVVVTNQPQVLFPDGELRGETSTTLYNFVITRNAVLTGAKQSGLRTGLSEATNTWYAIYAVKSQDATGFVTVGDTILPIRSNIATLNSNFGTNSWVYLGMIANGNNSNLTGDIVKFSQCGNYTRLDGTVTSGQSLSLTGIRLATTASAVTLSWTYAAGTNIASGQLPNNIGLAEFQVWHVGRTGVSLDSFDAAQNFYYQAINTNNANTVYKFQARPDLGIRTKGSTGVADPMDIHLSAFWDSALGVGTNPLV